MPVFFSYIFYLLSHSAEARFSARGAHLKKGPNRLFMIYNR
jgi:hypothetical protein